MNAAIAAATMEGSEALISETSLYSCRTLQRKKITGQHDRHNDNYVSARRTNDAPIMHAYRHSWNKRDEPYELHRENKTRFTQGGQHTGIQHTEDGDQPIER